MAKIVRGAVRRALTRANIDATLVPFLAKLVYYLSLAAILVDSGKMNPGCRCVGLGEAL